MKTLSMILVIAVVVIGGFYLLNDSPYTAEEPDTMSGDLAGGTMLAHSEAQVVPIEHATGILRWNNNVIYFDPTGGASAFEGQPAANIILVTDVHGDHLEPETLEAVIGDATLIVPQAVKDELPENLAMRAKVLANGASLVEQGLTITGVPMYNRPEAENAKFHAKGRGNGYIIEQDGYRVYIAGDTAGIPEMRALQNIAIALVPMNLPYTMDVEEAADAVLAFKPKKVYPYHYRGQDGLSDVNKFKELVNAGDPNIEVVLANWYPQQ
jgi:L-ascorbate metabolism protein UlaG (beta-lactamase superfamily)